MLRVFVGLVLLVMSLGPVRAEPPVVVELFTSQGCSSCPPADALLGRLAEREDVIALALHVDYWDYIGWADSFADPKFTRRQKGYAAAQHERTIYTPQMIVDGEVALIGHEPMQVLETVSRLAQREDAVAIEATRRDGAIVLRLAAKRPFESDAVVHVVRYVPRATVAIERGENAGKTLAYHNIVTHWETVATWSGEAPLVLRHEVGGAAPAVVIVQEARYGPILAAARAR